MLKCNGDQRLVVVQATRNKKRQKRRGKRLKKARKGLLTRVIYLLNNGTLLDYTHQREVDPFWTIIYKTYERLQQLNFHIRALLKSLFLTEEIATELLNLLEVIQKEKKKLLGYMMNGLEIQYAAAVNARFYGWKHQYAEFRSSFINTALTNIYRMSFDTSRTRPSVYFYQSFWLSGIVITQEAMEEVRLQEEVTDRYNRMRKDPKSMAPEEELNEIPLVEGDLTEGLRQLESAFTESEEEADFTPERCDELFESLSEIFGENGNGNQKEALVEAIFKACGLPREILFEAKTPKDFQALASRIRKELRRIGVFDKFKKMVESPESCDPGLCNLL